jgi:hypothetical protein
MEKEVLFLGNRADVPALLSAADICVLASIQENCPYAVMEAQVAGRAMIASAVGGIPEMIRHGETGLLSEAGSSDSLFRQLRQALDDDELRKGLGERAHIWGANQWSLERMQTQTTAVYERACKELAQRSMHQLWQDWKRCEIDRSSAGSIPFVPASQLRVPGNGGELSQWPRVLSGLPERHMLPDSTVMDWLAKHAGAGRNR